jgi:hypothetical protein
MSAKQSTSINTTKIRLTAIYHADQPMGLATLLPSKRRMLAGHQGAHIVASGQTAPSTATVGTWRLTRKYGIIPRRRAVGPFPARDTAGVVATPSDPAPRGGSSAERLCKT